VISAKNGSVLDVIQHPASTSGSYTINIADKSGTVGSTSITQGQTVIPLPAIPSAIAALALASLEQEFASFNQSIATSTALNSDSFGSLISNSYLNNGMNKTQLLAYLRNPTGSLYLLGAKLSNPVINSCTTAGTCNVTFLVTLSDGSLNKINDTYIYSSGSWYVYGNQQPDVQIGFETFAQLSNSSSSFVVGIDFGISGGVEPLASNPYNSATATFQDANGNVDYTVQFVQKTSVGGSCAPSSSNYYGLPITDVANPSSTTPDLSSANACNNWINFADQTVLNTINSHIAAGGYRIIVKAYTTNNWTGTPVIATQSLSTPLITSDVMNIAMFPQVQPKTDSTGPYLSIPNAGDYTLIGSVCLSSSTSVGYCDMTNLPPYTSVYNFNNNVALANSYRPKSADGWPSGQTIQSYFVHAQDKYGRDLRVNN
jgi:hypothetical protein